MKMQRRHFEFIARNLLAVQPADLYGDNGRLTTEALQWGNTVIRFTDECDNTNDYFKRQTFLYAAGMTDELLQAGGWA
jgi:hypothetical protein